MEKKKLKIPKFSLLPNKTENVVLNTFLNASVKTLGFIVGLQALTFIYWKVKMPVGKAIRFFLFKELLFVPFFYYWYRKLKASTYEELDKLDINITPIIKEQVDSVKTEEVVVHPNIAELIQEVKAVNRVKEEIKNVAKDKLHVSYVLE